MHRSLERRHFSVSDVASGEVLIASTFAHPIRGTVDCSAAPLVEFAMVSAGLRMRRKPVPRVGSGDGILHVVSYIDPNGLAVGLGVAAHRDDRQAVCRAEEIVRTWAGVMRTRRVLVEANGPSCAGLRREAAMLAQVTGPAYVLATGRHHAPFPWPRQDMYPVERLVDVPEGATVVIPAHGVDQQTRTESVTRGLRVVDATCPLVARTHATARRFADEGAAVVVIGHTSHAAVPPIIGQVPGDVAVVATISEADELVVDAPDGVAFVVSPGLAVEDATEIAARLRSRFTSTRGQHPDQFCHAASDRRAAVRAVAAGSELTLVLGEPTSGDTQELVATAAATGSAVRALDDLAGLRPDWLGPVVSVGVVVGTTARPSLAGEIIEVLSGLGPLSIARRQITTEIQHASRVHTGARQAG